MYIIISLLEKTWGISIVNDFFGAGKGMSWTEGD